MPIEVHAVAADSECWPAVVDYARAHLDIALLVAGDMGPLLQNLSVYTAAFESGRVAGVAVRFAGFANPSFSVAAGRSEIADLLLRALPAGNGLLAVSSDQPLPESCTELIWSTDPWLRGSCAPDASAENNSEVVSDAAELAAFYRTVGSVFWCPEMLEPGTSRVIRDQQGAIAAAGSIQFVIPGQYAQVGAIATAPTHRGRGFSRTILSALRSTLSCRGVRECGVFAEAAHPWLERFYRRLGFRTVGHFRFAEIRLP